MYPINLRKNFSEIESFFTFCSILHKTPIKNAARKKSGQTRTLTAEHVIYRFASFFAQKNLFRASASVKPLTERGI